MITNEKEYAVAKATLNRFQQVLEDFDVMREIEMGVDPKIARAQKESFSYQIDQLESDLRRYEVLKSGLSKTVPVHGISGIGLALIQARIAKGLSQKALAEIIGLKEQQIQRYEKDYYRTANLRRLALVADALAVSHEGFFDLGTPNSTGETTIFGIPVGDFPFAEVRKSRWLGDDIGERRLSDDSKRYALMKFFSEAPAIAGDVLHRKTKGSIGSKRRAAIIMWQARVLRQAKEVAHRYPRFHPLAGDALKTLVGYSAKDGGLRDAVDLLSSHGIILVCQKHLSSTKLDGAALSLQGNHAIIALTLRHNRLDNLWFNLLHELGHLTRHWRKVSSFGIVDEDIGMESDELFEREADEFARNAIIPDDAWRNSMVRYTNDSEIVCKFASRFGVHPALVAGRIRHERGYSSFTSLLGQGEPKKLMAELGLWSEGDEVV